MNPHDLALDLISTSYRDLGYAVIEGAFSRESLNSIREAALRIVDDFDINRHRSIFTTLDRDQGRDRYFTDSSEAIHCFLEADALDAAGQLRQDKRLSINKIGHALHDLDPAFRHFCKQPVVGQVLRSLGYLEPVLWQSMYIFKQPRIGGEVRWHQDASYLISKPGPVVAFWVAIEDAHRGNGCLWVQPGAHHSPLRDLYVYDHAAGHGELRTVGNTPWPSTDEAVAVEVPAGSLVIFHDHMPHFSSQNLSAESRHAFTMHFAERHWDWPAINWLQRKHLPEFRV